jgi:hypothetical protein
MNQKAAKQFRAATSAAIKAKSPKTVARVVKLKAEWPAATQKRKGQIRAWLKNLIKVHRKQRAASQDG